MKQLLCVQALAYYSRVAITFLVYIAYLHQYKVAETISLDRNMIQFNLLYLLQ